MLLIIKLFSYLPLWFLHGLASIFWRLAYYVIAYRKAVVYENLRKSFPDKSEAEIHRYAIDFYKNLADVLVEIIKGYSISVKDLAKRVKVVNGDILQKYVDSGTSCLAMTAHHCNWEWIMLRIDSANGYPISPVYKTLSNNLSNQFMIALRGRFGGNPVTMQDSVKVMLSNRHVPHIYALVADQRPGQEDKKYWTNFLNQDTAFFMGTERIAQITKFPVVFISMRRLKRGYYEITLETIAEPPYPRNSHHILEAYANALEKSIRESPAHWLWSHKRWKYTRAIDEKTTEA